MNFKDFILSSYGQEFSCNETNIDWFININLGDLIPLHLIEAKGNDDVQQPKYQILGRGDSNPKTAKHPDTNQTYLGAVLHLEPYMSSGHQTCPFATAIYKITIKNNVDVDTLRKIAQSPGYEHDDGEGLCSFFGFELRSMLSNSFGKLSDTLLPPKQQAQCPARMKIRLPGKTLRDWNTGNTIELNRSQIVFTKLVGGCANACLHTAGASHYALEKLSGRRKKTNELYSDQDSFMAKILLDVFKLDASANAQGHQPVVRLNATSDEAWEADYRFPNDAAKIAEALKKNWPSRISAKYLGPIQKLVNINSNQIDDLIAAVSQHVAGKTLIEVFKNIQWYDYTKNPSRMKQFLQSKNKKGVWPSNYHLTFSLAEGNRDLAIKFLKAGGNVAVVFNVKKGPRTQGDLPKTWEGFPVIDADTHDYRFLDTPGAVSGLRAKGEAKFQSTDFGFVIQPDDPGLDPNDPAVIQAKKDVEGFENRVKTGKITDAGFRRATMRDAGKKLNIPTYY